MSNAINDWKKSIFGQKGQKGSKKEKPRSTPKGLVGASKLISEFIERNMNTEFINRILKELQQENHQSISDLFTAKNACYHQLYIVYNIVVDQSPQDSGSSDILRSSKQRSGYLLGERKCLFCTKIDMQENLIEAGIKYATKKNVNVSHANETTTKWRYMSLALGKTETEIKFSIEDLGSNEIFYHRLCLTEFLNDFNALTESESKSEQDEIKKRIAWCKAVALCKVIDFIYEKYRQEPGSPFSVKP